MSHTVRQKYQDKRGAEFGAVFHGLWNDWAWGLMRPNPTIEPELMIVNPMGIIIAYVRGDLALVMGSGPQ